MFFKTLGLILIGIILVPTAAGALSVDIRNEREWLIANGSDSGYIILHTTSESEPHPYNYTYVSLTPELGSVNPAILEYANPNVITRFFATNRSGTARIKITIYDPKTFLSQEVIWEQKIDHSQPYRAEPLYTTPAQVNRILPISIRITDAYGNPVDNRNVVETVAFTTSGPSSFLDGTSPMTSITVPVNETGYAVAWFTPGTKGDNYIYYTLPAPLKSGLISIRGIYSGMPASITGAVSPDGTPPRLLADGSSRFIITYTLSDEQGGGSAGRLIRLTTSAGESMNITTNEDGLAQITYGPSAVPVIRGITATVPDNPGIASTTNLEFVDPKIRDMVLMANPDVLPSLDIKPSSQSVVKGWVVDGLGRPLSGETVSFQIMSITNGTTILTKLPALSNGMMGTDQMNGPVTKMTDGYGFAEVTFYPGEFTKNQLSPGYNATAKGTAVVRAVYGSIVKEITLTFRNYAFVSVVTRVTPQNVSLNQPIDVTIQLTGDGVALQPSPLNVVLAVDQSWSMGNTTPPWPIDGQPRIYWAKMAAKAFVGTLDPAKDKIAYLPFGTDPSITQTLTGNFATLNASIDSTNPKLDAAYGTNLRKALYLAIKHLKEAGSTDSRTVKAVVLITDGGWNHDGTPVAIGTGYPDTREYYNENSKKWTYYNGTQEGYKSWDNLNFHHHQGEYTYTGYKYFTALGGGTITTYDTANKQPLPTMTDKEDTKGWWDCSNMVTGCVPSASATKYSTKLVKDGEFSVQNMSIFAQKNNVTLIIIGYGNPKQELSSMHVDALKNMAQATKGRYTEKTSGDGLVKLYKDIAGELKTTAGVDVGMVLDLSTVIVNGTPMDGSRALRYVHEDGISTTIRSWNETHTIIPFHTDDQTQDWLDDRKLNFTIGTMTIGQTWEAKYRLVPTTIGSINIFGPASALSFEDDAGKVSIDNVQETYVYVNGSPSPGVLGAGGSVDVKNLVIDTGSIKRDLSLQWTLNYTGTGTVTQTLWYAKEDNPDMMFQYTSYPTPLPAGEYPLDKIDQIQLPAGRYIITVRASGSDGGYDEVSTHVEVSGERPTIRLS